ncbi:spinster family MFS transporter [Sphingopyxis lindanitolerans]|uniref:spinster family MFS transporter n=1 Tax=Sphingopyxis lindanitolerans TaxID=2054227 RepID=UPI0013050307|nr:MFS transporter [Sphingopyxis lindanitolerans]
MNHSDATQTVNPAPPGLRPWTTLFILTAVFVLANIDRNILAILLPSIQGEFSLADWQLGLLGGFAFSLMYGISGIFVSFAADRSNRSRIIAISLAVWSVMTMLCGAATSFVQLLFARAGVGLGEAGCSPPAHSLIADLFPADRRALALGIYAAGASAGLTLSYLIGAWLVQEAGWRIAFVAVGLPGVLLAPLVGFVAKDMFRARTKVAIFSSALGTAFGRNVALIWNDRVLRHVFLGASLAAGVSASTILFVPTYLMRTHGMSAMEVGLALGLLSGIVGSSGMIIGGWIADRIGRTDPARRLWVAVAAKVIALPALFLFLTVDDTTTALWLYAFPALVGGIWLGPTYAAVQTQSPPDSRAMGAALLLLTYNIIGFGCMPLLIGAASDLVQQASGKDGLAFAMLLLVPFSIWSALHFLLASRHMRRPETCSALSI